MRPQLLLALLLLAACSTTAGTAPPSAALPTARAEWGPGAAEDRLLVREAAVKLKTRQPAEAAEQVVEVARALGGRAESIVDREERSFTLVLRVPAAGLDSLLAAIAALGEVEDRRIRAVDVTEETTDLEARLQNLVAVRGRLRQHLERAATVADVIAVERELARVQTEIDQIEARLRDLRTRVAMSLVHLEIRQPRVLGPLGALLSGAAWVVEKLFVLR